MFAPGPCVHPVAPAIAVGSVRVGVMFVRNRCYTIVAYAYALPLLLVLSPWAAFVPGSCSPVCTPCRYSYRRGLCSHRGHVRPQSLLYYCGYCVHPGTIAIAVGYVRTGVMFTRVYTPITSAIAVGYVRIRVMYARGRCCRLPLQGLETLVLLLLYLMSMPRLSARALPGQTNRYGRALCSHVPAVIDCRFQDWILFLVLCRATQSTFCTGV